MRLRCEHFENEVSTVRTPYSQRNFAVLGGKNDLHEFIRLAGSGTNPAFHLNACGKTLRVGVGRRGSIHRFVQVGIFHFFVPLFL